MSFLPIFPPGMLYGLLILAVLFDIKYRRIPNKLVFCGMLMALFIHAIWPSELAIFNQPAGTIGFLGALQGLVFGFGLLFPVYLCRALGAGDVKLMAMIGAFTGPSAVIPIVLLSMLAGGFLAIIMALYSGTLRQVFQNIRFMVMHSFWHTMASNQIQVEKPPTVTGKLPYAIAIASGTIIYMTLVKSGAVKFLA